MTREHADVEHLVDMPSHESVLVFSIMVFGLRIEQLLCSRPLGKVCGRERRELQGRAYIACRCSLEKRADESDDSFEEERTLHAGVA
ncbi:hypothetical protein CBR_g50469 [Chara braunii]|uniref:Uncharacterized protein n=1 Tax=Chara braunii TaxID=69332 RepID=A0A388M6V6_CHABU|nr:hypothetical protein CBR_g50469 [Chara braunii]|eukprot:GBG90291.1 hypothetical protein CBR_g50469 [Chara braunii]